MISFKMRYSGATPKMLKKEWNAITREAWRVVGIYWHKKLRPKHFTRAGAREYGYEPRKGEAGNPHPKGFHRSYTGRKLREKGHTNPLVWTGESKMLTRLRDVRPTRKSTKIVMRVPRLNFTSPHSKVKPREELVRVTDREAKRIARVFAASVERSMRKMKGRETKRL